LISLFIQVLQNLASVFLLFLAPSQIVFSSARSSPPGSDRHHVATHLFQISFAKSSGLFNQRLHSSFFLSVFSFEMMGFPFFDRRNFNIIGRISSEEVNITLVYILL